MFVCSANFTRPANTTAYASGQLVANNTAAGSVVPLSFLAGRINGFVGSIRRARLKKSGTTVTAATFRLHLYLTSPTPANGDGGTWSTTESGYLGSVDLDLSGTNGRVFTDGAKVIAGPGQGNEMIFALPQGTQTIYGLLEARGSYTPVSGEVFTVELEMAQYG